MSAPDSSDARVGTVIADRYRITAKLGEGGMGAVYRGVHESLRKPVALKFMVPSARQDAELAQRFEREAVATANLKHPNISETTDYGQLPDGTLYLVMECIDGKNLRELVADGKLPPARALGIVKQIGAALSFAHESDVVHRDLKPDNVIVFDRGSTSDIVKVIDFGIARMKSSFGGGKTALTQAGTVFGTPDYMAPEQALGQAVDPRADQYALGAIAYELFTGKPPYAADNTAALMFMHVGAPIPRVGDLAPDLPPAVSDVVAKMMAKLPDERFVSVDEAVAALARAFEAPMQSSQALQPPLRAQSSQVPQPSMPAQMAPPVSSRVSTQVSPQMPQMQPPVPPPTLVSRGAFPAGAATAPPTERRPFPIAWALVGALLAVIAVGGVILFFALRQKDTSATSSDVDASDLGAAATTETAATATTEPTAVADKPIVTHTKPGTPAATKPSTATNATANATTANATAPAVTTVATPLVPAATAATPATTAGPTAAPTSPPPVRPGGPPPGHGHGHH